MVKRWTACVSNDESWWFEPREGEMPEPDSEMVLASDYDVIAAQLAGYKESHDKYCPSVARIAALEAALRQMKEAIYWALGERDDFPPEPEPIAGKYKQRYWWRTELRKRSGLPIGGVTAETPAKHTTEQDFQHWLSYSGNRKWRLTPAVREAYYAGAGATMETAETPDELVNGHYPSCGVGEGTHQGPCGCREQAETKGDEG